MRDCVKRLVEKSNNAIQPAAAREIIKMIDNAARRKANEGFNYDDAVEQVIAERLANTKANIVKQKKNMAKNVLIKTATVDRLSQFVDSGLSIVDSVIAELEGISSNIEGTRDSLDVARGRVENVYFSKVLGSLQQENLLGLFNSKKFSDEIGKEMWALSKGEKGATKSKQAARIAEILTESLEAQRLRLNKAGADIEKTAGGTLPQRHDTAEMIKVGEEKWVADILPLVDSKRSFGGDYGDLEQALRQAFRAMVTGTRLNDPLEKAPKLFQFNGPANLAKKLSQSRQIHFKDYDSWNKWNSLYGMRDLNEGIIDTLRFNSGNIATMERYGTNPEAMLKASLTELKRKYRDQAAQKGEQGVDDKLQSIVDNILEKNQIAADPRLAAFGSNIRTYQNVTKLGGALLSSVTDIPMKALEYQFQGKSWLSSSVQPFIDIAQGFKSKAERVEFASLMQVYSEGIVGDVGGRFSVQDNLGNKAAKVQRMFFKLNGLTWWTDTHKLAMQRTMSHHLGLMKDKTFDALDEDTKRLFGNYRITAKDWDSIRGSATQLEDGRFYVAPSKIDNAEIAEKLTGYFVDRAEFGVLTPGARERRIATAGTRAGTPMGEIVRMVMQFKSFPITAITKVWGRTLYGKGKADMPAMAYLMLMSMSFGYLAGAMKDIVKGRSPKDPTKLETVYASLAQGGGLGILGDVLLQDGSGMGRSLSQTLAGPTFGTIDEVFKIYSAGMRGDGSARQAAMFGVNSIPFNNLFYTRAAFDQILLIQMQEGLNPGYIRRMENNLKNTYGQELIFR